VNRRTWIIAAAALAAVALGVGLAPRFGGKSTEHRVRRYFPVRGALDTVSLREAVLRAVPIGSPESRLAWFAEAAVERSPFATAFLAAFPGRAHAPGP